MKNFIFLFIAICCEVVGTSALKASNEFTKLWPSVLTIVMYAAAFYCLSLTLRSIPVGVAYAIWSGVGIVLVTLVAIVLYNQKPDLPAIVGLGLIIAGVVVINVFSKMSAH
ncbi:multidrug efflux SMR transporter [Myroides sp. N17-2]|uniref:DMT family transporter n=1 Tax=Myroides sp. N17-2 TaxID=2030799 RepID=UPI000EFD02CA|nr:multidrug efflux SMR transporter [Myroides sp. N17-2]